MCIYIYAHTDVLHVYTHIYMYVYTCIYVYTRGNVCDDIGTNLCRNVVLSGRYRNIQEHVGYYMASFFYYVLLRFDEVTLHMAKRCGNHIYICGAYAGAHP